MDAEVWGEDALWRGKTSAFLSSSREEYGETLYGHPGLQKGKYYANRSRRGVLVILMAPFFGAGGPMQLCLQRSCRPGLHRSSGLQKAQAIQDDEAPFC